MRSFVQSRSQKAPASGHADQAFVRYDMPVRQSSPHQRLSSPTKTSATSHHGLKMPTKSSRFSANIIAQDGHAGFDTDSEAADTTTITSFQQDQDEDLADDQDPGQLIGLTSDDYQREYEDPGMQSIPMIYDQLDLATTIEELEAQDGTSRSQYRSTNWNADGSYPNSNSEYDVYQDEASEHADFDDSPDRPGEFTRVDIVGRQNDPPYQQPLTHVIPRKGHPEMQDNKPRVLSKQGSHQNTLEPQYKIVNHEKHGPAGQDAQIPEMYGQVAVASTASEPQMKMYASHKAAKRSRFQYRATLEGTTTIGPEKQSDTVRMTDYEQNKLAETPFERLQNEDMDYDPSAEAKSESQEDIGTRLSQLISATPDDQAKFFQTLSLQQWEEGGDWFLGQFQQNITRFTEIRKAKREVTREFEGRISQRHNEVKNKGDDIDAALSAMRTSGKSLLSATPTRGSRRKP